jgi:hypothetical protein
MDEERIKDGLNACLLTDEEVADGKWRVGYQDEWPV